MKPEEYRFIEDTIRELSLFIRNARLDEERERRKSAFKVVYDKFAPTCSAEALQPNNNVGSNFGENLFTEKELKKMPKLKELSYRYRLSDGVHEFRYRRNGFSKSFASTDFKIAKQKALTFCRELNQKESLLTGKSTLFNIFAEDYMQNVKKKNVAERTFSNDYNRFKNYILPTFENVKIKDVTTHTLQKFLNGVIDKGNQRTAEALFYLLKTILDYAVQTDVLQKNPLSAVKIPLHKRTIGKALPLNVEKKFVGDITGNKYELTFLVMLYTGARPCELESLMFNKPGFVTFRNRKQKKGTIVYKDIPITPMLEPYVERIRKSLPLPKTSITGRIFKKLVPGYRFYDLRHTFATRCQTCGVSQSVVAGWMGHKSSSITDNTYTHLPEEYMLKEAKKVIY